MSRRIRTSPRVKLERVPGAELYLERVRDRGRRRRSSHVIDRLVEGRRRERVGPVILAEIRAVRNIEPFSEDPQLVAVVDSESL